MKILQYFVVITFGFWVTFYSLIHRLVELNAPEPFNDNKGITALTSSLFLFTVFYSIGAVACMVEILKRNDM